MGPVGHEPRAMNREQIAMARPDAVRRIAIENLHLNRPREGHSGRRQSIAVNEQSGVAAPAKMFPVQFENEILIHLRRAHHARGHAGRNDHPVPNAKGVWRTIHIDPPGQVSAVEEGNEGLLARLQVERQEQREQTTRFHRVF